MTHLVCWFNRNAAILVNAGSILGTRVVTSLLGFIYWWLAARMFVPEMVGLSSTAVSAMMLLGTIGVLGMSTLLIGELPSRPGERGTLIMTALCVVGVASMCLGILFAIAAPYLSDELTSLAQNLGNIMLFAVGVMLTTTTLVLDQAVIGLLMGHIQFWRNTIFAASKLILLFMAGRWLSDDLGLVIYATWALGNVISLGYVAVSGIPRQKASAYYPRWSLLKELKGTAMKHYALNLSLQVPGFTLPLIVTVFLSITSTANFYMAWMIVSFLFTMPYSLTTVLYAVGAADPSVLAEKARFTLKLSLVFGVLGAGTLLIGGYPIMHLFGETYAEQATSSLRILSLAIFPSILKVHFVAISQISGRMLNAAKVMAVGGVLELALAGAGARIAGLAGLSLGWLIAMCIEAAIATPLVYRTALSTAAPVGSATESY